MIIIDKDKLNEIRFTAVQQTLSPPYSSQPEALSHLKTELIRRLRFDVEDKLHIVLPGSPEFFEFREEKQNDLSLRVKCRFRPYELRAVMLDDPDKLIELERPMRVIEVAKHTRVMFRELMDPPIAPLMKTYYESWGYDMERLAVVYREVKN